MLALMLSFSPLKSTPSRVYKNAIKLHFGCNGMVDKAVNNCHRKFRESLGTKQQQQNHPTNEPEA